jgi:YegS/Rv2252/BmrU family lipid kinase
MKPLLIVNPRAGGGHTGAVFDKLRGPIERALGGVDVALTERPRHAIDLARDAALAGRATIVAVGGDGSIHEVVRGLMQAREQGAHATRLGIIGQGTGGDFRRTLGIEHRLDRYCSAIAGGKTRAVDVGRFSYATEDGRTENACFINILSTGIGGLVDRYVAEGGRQLGGTLTYFVASVRGLLASAVGVLQCTLTYKGQVREEEIETRQLAICNGRFFGSGMHVAPMAEPDDGIFEIVSLGSAPRLRFALASSKMYTASHIGQPGVAHYRCEKIVLDVANRSVVDRFPLDVDGEPFGRPPLVVEVVPRAIEVLVPDS